MKIIPSRIAEARKLAGMSQRDLAGALGVTVQAVSQWENGKTDAGSRLASLALALKCNPDFLLNEEYLKQHKEFSEKGLVSVGNRVAFISIDNAPKWIFEQRTENAVSEIVIRTIFATHEVSLNAFAVEVSSTTSHFRENDVLIFDQVKPKKGDYVCAIILKAVSQIESHTDGTIRLPAARGIVMKLTGSQPDELTGERVRIRPEDDLSDANTSVVIIGALIEHRTFPKG